LTANIPGKIAIEKSPYFGIPTGIKESSFALTQLTALRNKPGWLVKEEKVEEWKITGFTRIKEEIYLYGPFLDQGRSLLDIIILNAEEALPYIKKLVSALLLLPKRGYPLFDLQLDTVFFPQGGGVFFLPPEVIKTLRNSQAIDKRLLVYDLINRPGLSGEKRLSFSLGSLLYRIITGNFPFTGEDEEILHSKMKLLTILPPELSVPQIKPEVSDIVMNALGRGDNYKKMTDYPHLDLWQEKLSSWIRGNIFQQIDIARIEEAGRLKEIKEKKAAVSYSRKVFWQRNWKAAALILGAVIIVSIFLSSILSNVLAPRKTKGFPPARIVESFYLSMNSLDHMLMQDCVIDKAGKAEIKEVTHLYVLSRVSKGYEGQSSILPADEWQRQGRPELIPPQTVFGVTDLHLLQEAEGTLPVFTATYKKWLPAPQEEEQIREPAAAPAQRATFAPLCFEVKERLFLRNHRDDWVIFNIERLDIIPIDY
jgi:hypothetical protein